MNIRPAAFAKANGNKRTACTTSSKSIGQCQRATARRRARRGHVYLRSRPTVVPVAQDRRLASNTVPSKRACSGYRTRIIRRLDGSRWIHTFASAARSASVRDQMARFLTAARGMRSKWCPPMTGKRSTESHCLISRPLRLLLKKSIRKNPVATEAV
jgi:hypothetical protein